MGCDAFRARYFSDQSDRVPNAFRRSQRCLRRLRRILHWLATAARRTVPPVAALSFAPLGWVAEWSNAHAWKACLPKGNQGSNPCPSATRPMNGPFSRERFWWIAPTARQSPAASRPGDSDATLRCWHSVILRENSRPDISDNRGLAWNP